MRYKKFIIENYRSIVGPLEVNIDKNPLMPIIGVNESGKTTILQAIYAFDKYNDESNDTERHLLDTKNLKSLAPAAPIISAEIEITSGVLKRQLSLVSKNLTDKFDDSDLTAEESKELEDLQKSIRSYKKKIGSKIIDRLVVSRSLEILKYDIDLPIFTDSKLNHLLAERLLASLPYILYFDDFRDSIEEKIEIRESGASSWLGIIEQLFKATDKNLSVFNLSEMEPRQRKTSLAAVEKKLNKSLTLEWPKFKLDNIEALNIKIEFEEEVDSYESTRSYLKLEVMEKNNEGAEHFFYIRDRSKGFFWFFNFVMKLQFNPKIAGSSGYKAIYLLDEPGSYLHAAAQQNLCKKLKELSESNRVLYATHSHYLLNPEVIPISTIKIAGKNSEGNACLTAFHDYKEEFTIRRSAFQPIYDALKINPFSLEFFKETVLIVEGICDFYAFEMLKGDASFKVLPSVGADSMKFYISLMIAWQINYLAIWDNDIEGRKEKGEAEKFFGSTEAENHFLLLPLTGGQSKNTILQDLFDGEDLGLIRKELGIANSSFDKALTALFYSKDKNEILKKLKGRTTENVRKVIKEFNLN